MTHVETNEVLPTVAQVRRDEADTYHDQIIAPLNRAEGFILAAAQRLHERDDDRARRAREIAEAVEELRVELGGGE